MQEDNVNKDCAKRRFRVSLHLLAYRLNEKYSNSRFSLWRDNKHKLVLWNAWKWKWFIEIEHQRLTRKYRKIHLPKFRLRTKCKNVTVKVISSKSSSTIKIKTIWLKFLAWSDHPPTSLQPSALIASRIIYKTGQSQKMTWPRPNDQKKSCDRIDLHWRERENLIFLRNWTNRREISS